MKDQGRRLAQLEDMLKEAQLRPLARRRCMDGQEDASSSLERQVGSIAQELQVASLFACVAKRKDLSLLGLALSASLRVTDTPQSEEILQLPCAYMTCMQFSGSDRGETGLY